MLVMLTGVANFELYTLHFELGTASAQPAVTIKSRLADYFSNYTNSEYTNADPIRLTDVTVDSETRTLTLAANAGFASQPFTRETVGRIRREVVRLIPPPYNAYRIVILANGTPIEDLVPFDWSDTVASRRRWGELEHRGYPWVAPLSLPYSITQGLQGRHFSVWASHGRYYDFNKNNWQWQRPRLYCTTEDLFTQSFVVPFLIPMLENAGAVVFSPRERDWQREEVVVDNDVESPTGTYTETNGLYPWENGGSGFAHSQTIYRDRENPFEMGTFRKAEAQPRKRQTSQIVWRPELPADGRYAVYVSYATLPTSVSDAEYTVRHRGMNTKFRVNQKMGGGTWVYLGTFDFGTGAPVDNCVILSNQSNYRGTVTADAVRFGGGMGNIARGDSIHDHIRSGLPRYLEGSRYYAQWAGMPFATYANREGTNDYAEDINARSLSTNRLARGSVYLPGDSGLCVPIELSLAVHSDAGFRPDRSHIGTLGIYTTGIHTPGDFTDSLLLQGLLPSLRSRLMSRDLCDMVMTQVDQDLRHVCGTWNRRQIYDRNYSETRVPQVPGIILETLSHQNFADLLRGHDPNFKMWLSRAIYKGILKYTASVHALPAIVAQPLPVSHFSARLDAKGDSVTLSWRATTDPTDSLSQPTGYVVYVSEGDRGYDNGQAVPDTQIHMPVRRGVLTKFQIRAFNEGGSSLPSEELCVYSPRNPRHRVLIVNAFQRLAGPQPIDTDSTRGFDIDADPGVVYRYSPCYCGRQVNFAKSTGEDFGQSGNELEGMLIAGNTFDFPTLHARDFLMSDTTLAISSCSRRAYESDAALRRAPSSSAGFNVIDLILGAQRNDGYSMEASPAFTPELCTALSDYAKQGGALLVSGAYITDGLPTDFAAATLHLAAGGSLMLNDTTANLVGMNTSFSIYHAPNEERYSVPRISEVIPLSDAFPSIAGSGHSFAVAYPGDKHRTLTYGFPLECIRQKEIRQAVLAASLTFLLTH